MKTKLFLFSACAGLFLLASCSAPGPSAESKAKVAAFDSAWSAMGTMASAWGDSLTQAVTLCENACKAGEEMACCQHLKGTKDSLMMPCMNDKKTMQEMKTAWDAEMPMWNEMQAKLDTLKANVASGKATDEQVTAALAELQGAADKGAAGMGPWVEKFNTCKASCMSNMAACKSGWSGATCKEKKCPGAAKKS